MSPFRTYATVLLLALLAAGGFLFYKGYAGALRQSKAAPARTLRYTNTLLGVDTYTEKQFFHSATLEDALHADIEKAKREGIVTEARILFHELSRGGWATTGAKSEQPALATAALVQIFKQYEQSHPGESIFEEVGISPAQKNTTDTESLFWRALYNATYLGKEGSESALSRFATLDGLGFEAGLPRAVPVTHLPWNGIDVNSHLFSAGDCGIAYDRLKPFVLCASTRGKDLSGLADFLREVASTTYAALPGLYH